MSHVLSLTLSERFQLMEIIPREGEYSTLKIVRKLRETLSPSEEEHEKYEIKKEVTGQAVSYQWNNAGSTDEVELTLKNKAFSIVKESLQELNNKKKMNEMQMTLYEKVIKPEPDDDEEPVKE